MRRKEFTPTPVEIEYWRRIHDLNEAERKRQEKPVPVREFIIQTFELVTAEGGRP